MRSINDSTDLRYLYINSFGSTFSEDLMTVIFDHSHDEALNIEEIVVKKVGQGR